MTLSSQSIQDIEEAFETHWRRFGLYPGASLADEDGVLWYQSSIPHLPYNAVIRSRLEPDKADTVIELIDRTFFERQVPYMWVVRPSDTPNDLGTRLSRLSLSLATCFIVRLFRS